MKELVIFVLGSLFGALILYFYGANITHHESHLTRPSVERTRIDRVYYSANDCENKSGPAVNGEQDFELSVSESKLEALFTHFASKNYNIDGSEYKDLSHYIRNDKIAAQQVRNRLLTSNSYEERYALMNALSNDHSMETIELGIELINGLDSPAKNLGFELLANIGAEITSPELNAALLDAVSYELDEEFLAESIYRLSQVKLDEEDKLRAVSQLHSVIGEKTGTVKARAIDTLAKLGDENSIHFAIKDNLFDSHQSVRLSAIGGVLNFQRDTVDSDLLYTLSTIQEDESEPENIRRAASSVLDFFGHN